MKELLVKKPLIIGIIIFLLLDVAIYFFVKHKKNSGNQQNTTTATKATKKKSGNFMWGIMIRPNELTEYDDASREKYWKNLNDLGVNWVRMQYTYQDPQMFETQLQKAESLGINVVAIIPPEIVPNKMPDGSYNAADIDKVTGDFVKKYAGRIPYYQIGAELGNFVLNDPHLAGVKKSDFNDAKFKKESVWIKTIAEAIRKNDPKAKIILNINRTHFGIIDKLNDINTPFDVIGISWYSDNGTNFTNMQTGDPAFVHFNIIDKIKSYGKEGMLSEVAYRMGSKDGGDKQAQYVTDIVNQVIKDGFFKNIFMYEYLDAVPQKKASADEFNYGFLNRHNNGTTWVIDDPKKAYYNYADAIKSNNH